MKKIILSLALLLIAINFFSCSRERGIDLQIQENAANLLNAEKDDAQNSEAEYYGNFMAENNYVSSAEKDWTAIVYPKTYPSNFFIDNDKLYFSLTKPCPDGSSKSYAIEAAIDLNTGEKSYLCSDPVCTHEYDSDCGAIHMLPSIFWEQSVIEISPIFRSDNLTDIEVSMTNLQTNAKEVIAYFKAESDGRKEMLNFTKSYIFEDTLYFTLIRSYTDVESKTEIRIREFYSYDLIKRKLSEPMLIPEKYSDGSPFFSDNDCCYWFIPYYGILTTDKSFENEKMLYDFGGVTPNQCNWYYDTQSGEMLYLIGNKKTQTGTVYSIKNGEIEPLSLPHENISYFYLTNDKIYYTAYEDAYAVGGNPTGQGELGSVVYDCGVIYVTDRYEHKEAAVFFDNGQERKLYLHDGWMVLDGNLYLTSMSYSISTTNTVSFSTGSDRKVIRINPENNTIRYFRFD
ncbi:MAG: hypothetical protein ACI4XJ_03150 [Eubacteriales bacterium]